MNLPVGIPGAPRVNRRVARDLGPTATIGDAYVATALRTLRDGVDPTVLSDVPSVYIGGGTPTMLGERRLRTLIEGVFEVANVRTDAELTVEANPDSIDASLVEMLVAHAARHLSAGVLRVSLGVQSFDDEVLQVLGRRHDAAGAHEALSVLMSSGIRASLDLMCGVPGQSLASWRESVVLAIDCGVGHISVYPLTIEEGTPFARALASGELEEPDEDLAAEMMELAEEMLQEAGLNRYEVANYARPGEESRHNSGYWTGVEYLGVGPSASSMLSPDTAVQTYLERELGLVAKRHVVAPPGSPEAPARLRFSQSPLMSDFLTTRFDTAPEQLEWLTAADALREDAMLGLRLTRGITDDLASAAGVAEVLGNLQERGLVVHDAGWRLTPHGWLLANEVFRLVWTGE